MQLEVFNVKKVTTRDSIIFHLEGRLNTETAPVLDNMLSTCNHKNRACIFNAEKLDYISSAGLKVFLTEQKRLGNKQKLFIENVKPEIMEVFQITGFDTIINIQAKMA